MLLFSPSTPCYCYYNDDNQDGTLDETEKYVGTRWADGKLGYSSSQPLCNTQQIATLSGTDQLKISYDLADDLNFMDFVVDFVNTNYTIDNKRIYLAGNGNGASMAARLAVERSNTYAAATFNAGKLEIPQMQADRPMSVFMSWGTLDTEFEEENNVLLGASQYSLNNADFSPIIDAQLYAHNLSDNYTYTYTEAALGGENTGDFIFSESLGTANNSMRVLMIEGTDRDYPNEAINMYWAFVKDEVLP